MDCRTQVAASTQFPDARAGDGMIYVVVGHAVRSRFVPATATPGKSTAIGRKFHFPPEAVVGRVNRI